MANMAVLTVPVLAYFVLVACFSELTTAGEDLECRKSEYFSFDWSIVYYQDFSHLSQLDLVCDLKNFVTIESIDFDFSACGILSESVNISTLLEMIDISSIVYNHLAGLDISMPSPMLIIDEAHHYVKLGIQRSKFDFYYQARLVDADLCDVEIFEGVDVQLFSRLHYTTIEAVYQNSFKNPICPYAFKNALIFQFVVSGLQHTLVYPRTLRFLEIKNKQNVSINLNSRIRAANFVEIYRVDIDEHLLNPLVFAQIAALAFKGLPGLFQENLIQLFNRISQLEMKLAGARGFFHSSDNKWMRHLFHQEKEFASKQELAAYLQSAGQNSNSFYLFIAELFHAYDYPDEDLCLFKYFPWKRVITVRLYYKQDDQYKKVDQMNRSLTIRFLLQNNRLIENYVYWTDKRLIYPMLKIRADEPDIKDDEFENLLASCDPEPLKKPQKTYLDSYDWTYFLEWAELIGPVLTFPIVSAVAFVLNLIIIRIIRNKQNRKEKLFDSKIFSYILLNSIFNCAECFIYQFRLMGICMGENSLFCSSIRYNTNYQYFGALFTGYLSETMKTCSIVTGLFFSLQRYIEASKSSSRVLLFFSRLKIKIVGVCIFFYSSIVSVPKYFEYSIDRTVNYDSPDPFRMNLNTFEFFEAGSVMYLIHYALNDLFILVVNLIIDVCLVRIIKSNLELKMEVQRHLAMVEGDGAPKSELKKLSDEENRKKSIENKANSLIIANIFIYVFCRLPELSGMYYFFFGHPSEKTHTCFVYLFCHLLLNVIEYLYMLAYLLNIVLYYRFNSNFKKGFRNYFGIN